MATFAALTQRPRNAGRVTSAPFDRRVVPAPQRVLVRPMMDAVDLANSALVLTFGVEGSDDEAGTVWRTIVAGAFRGGIVDPLTGLVTTRPPSLDYTTSQGWPLLVRAFLETTQRTSIGLAIEVL